MSDYKSLNTMIDLETLGNGYDGVITAIGACNFNIETGEIFGTFYKPINWGAQIKDGRSIDADTIKWWMLQNKEAQAHLYVNNPLPLDKVLEEFLLWLPANCIVWGNGPTFDIGKLEFAYGLDNIPWGFKNVRCVRTIRSLAEGLVNKSDIPFDGNPHNPLDDAKYQAKYVSAMWQALRKGLPDNGYKELEVPVNDF